jgi:hypothetical protein
LKKYPLFLRAGFALSEKENQILPVKLVGRIPPWSSLIFSGWWGENKQEESPPRSLSYE